VKASHTDQIELLELQKLDQKESALRHKRDSHPAHATVREFAGRVADLQRAAISQSAVIADTMREVTRIEDEIAKVTERRKRQQSRIDNNQVPLRDISAMEHEIAQMDRRLAKLEDDQVEAEERVEAARAAQDKMKAEAQAIAADIDLPIYHGTDDETLLRGLGHLEGTSLPVGGQGQRTVVTGHRGLAEARMFTDLDKVQVGDTFTFEVFGEVLTYRVFDKKVVNPEETEALRSEPGRDLATLVTCTPLGINTHRILVTGERVYPTPQRDIDAAGAAPDIPGFPWWALGLLGGVSLIGLYIWRSGYPPRPKRRPTLNK